MPNQKDYYHILGVDKHAGKKQIKDAYRKLAFQYHPDRNRDNPGAAEQMKSINEAYVVLSDPAKRRTYDALQAQYGPSARSQFRKTYSEQDIFQGSDVHRVFEELSRAFGYRGFDDVFKEAYGQNYQHFTFKKGGGAGRGFSFYGPFVRRGYNNTHGSTSNPIGKISRFLLKRMTGIELPEDGADIHDIICLTPQHALQGGPYAYFHYKKDKKLVVKIPPGVREGQKIRLSGMGEPGKGDGKPGDLMLKVSIKKPMFKKVKQQLSNLIKSVRS